MKTEAQEEIDQQNAVNAETVERVLRMLRLHQADPAFGPSLDEEEFVDALGCV